MWETIKAEFKHLWEDKWRFAGFILMLFIPFVYGFFYMNAYWAPFSHVDKLRIAVVSRDLDANGNETKASQEFVKTIKGKTVQIANQIYDIEPNQSIADNPRAHVDNGEYAAVVVVPSGYEKAMGDLVQDIASDLKNNHHLSKTLEQHFEKLKEDILTTEKNTLAQNKNWSGNPFSRVTVYNSFKHSYLAGEMTNFIAGAMDITVASIESPITSAIGNQFDEAKNMLKTIWGFVGGAHAVDTKETMNNINYNINNIIQTKTSGMLNSYGFGLAPYFISIALWAGALSMTFILKNERHIKTVSTGKHLLGKWMMWVFSGWVQSIILVTAVTLQGVQIGADKQWELYLFALFMSTIFTSVSMGVFYCFRYGDIGEFAVVILLVLQLISSSGTFPVEMQNVIFKIIHPVAPFTYTIEAIREIFYDTNTWIVLRNMLILLAFPVVIMPICFLINLRFDRKNFDYKGIIKEYKSYEIHLGDF